MSQEELAIGFFVLIAVVPVVGFLIWSRKTPFDPFRAFWYLVTILLARILWRAKVPPMPVPPGQGAVVVSNHRGSVDPFFIALGTNRHIHWMVAREYCRHPAFGWFLRLCEVIPVNRGGIDTASTKRAIRLASEGGLVGVFPEGRINMTDKFMLPGRPGAILVALKARVPIVPCFIQGSPYDRTPWSPFLMRAKVIVRFGEPIDLSPYYDRERDAGLVGQLMLEAIKAIAGLAGREDFEPSLAGRRWKPTEEEVDRDMAASLRLQSEQ
ncbi:MAG: 1-acyl-sn-glycerol-3-phosphate acyltransferase [Planctomycetes bacterium]|nr:1-acyl-sn-glycerol-3-phosphate acyltransferase [Planctomycetota bacterium]MBL7040238.1 1-acyl-sn-glycerol-3-phosphate acyltransferase [Pirellulaceae bacterium]